MFLPLGDEPNPRGVPVVTYALIAANCVVYLFTLPLSTMRPDLNDPALTEYLRVIAESIPQRVPLSELLRYVSRLRSPCCSTTAFGRPIRACSPC